MEKRATAETQEGEWSRFNELYNRGRAAQSGQAQSNATVGRSYGSPLFRVWGSDVS
jgi:hypothetical protein